jgi:hypothetical protein
MAHIDSFLDRQWLDGIIAAAEHLSLCSYFTGHSGAIGVDALSTTDATSKLKTPKSEFVQNRTGVVSVNVGGGTNFEVHVQTKNGVTSLHPQRMTA